MTVVFSEDEQMWLKMEKFNWSIKKDCPTEIRKEIERKLKALNKFAKRMDSQE